MWAALRSRALSLSSTRQWKLGFPGLNRTLCSSLVDNNDDAVAVDRGLLKLDEVQKILTDVKADNISVVPVGNQCEWTDFMVFATGRSAWHVRNIAQALIYKVKQKQRGAERMLLPSIEGEKEGKWIVIDSGTIIVHAFDEKARAYYNLESRWTDEMSTKEQTQDLDKALIKVRRKNNSKRPVQRSA
ncbi:protein Iojap-related, mitochondrial isoform X1 [Rhododendron vialii]|uniref:protein Iojap-related, mitochondrial isoform X1 n=1 Tax=Rhododendron vialii TaxID=182163 RepID=UPI00265DA61F|nr:protein Iojap-related, mitochondrial isoform X1 [Rhododendron vialii]